MLKLSPSQILKFESCERAWYFQYVMGIRQPATPAQQLGLDVETLLENWIERGDPPPATKAGMIARSGIPFLPRRTEDDPPFVLQQEFSFKIDETVSLGGRKDLVLPGRAVWDFKTTGDFRRVKTPADLRKDIQAQTYAHDEMTRHGLKSVPLRWLYMRTTGPSAAVVSSLDMTAGEASACVERAVRAGRRIAELRAERPEIKDVRPTWSFCQAFGGCPHRTICPRGNETLGDLVSAALDKFVPSSDTRSQEDAMLSDKLKNALAKSETTDAPPDGPERSVAPPEPFVEAPEPAPEPTTEPAKRGRGRPKKARQPDAEEKPSVRRVLLVGCAVTGMIEAMTPPRNLSALLGEAAALAANRGGQPHWRMVEFGKGAGLLQLAFAEIFERENPGGFLQVDPRGDEARIVLDWLKSRCDVVVTAVT